MKARPAPFHSLRLLVLILSKPIPFQAKMSIIPFKKPIVAPTLDTRDNIQLYIHILYYQVRDNPQHPYTFLFTPEEFKGEKLPYSKKFCEWNLRRIAELQEINRHHIKLLKEHILDKKVPGEMRKAQRKIKSLKEANTNLMYSKDCYHNGGIC